MAVEIVIDDRFFDPRQAQIVDHVAAPQRVGEVEALVEIGHQFHVAADSGPDCLDGGEVVARAIATQPKFQGGESAFVAQRERVRRQHLRRLQPQPIAVIGLHGPDRAAEQDAKRHVGCFCERVPRRHVQSGNRDQGLALVSDEMQRLARQIVKLDRGDAPPLQHLAEILQGRDQVAHRLDGVRLEIAAPDDTFFREQIDQDQRPIRDGGYACYDWALELEHDRSRADRFKGQ